MTNLSRSEPGGNPRPASWLLGALLLLATAPDLTAQRQRSGGIRGPVSAPSGGTMVIEVGTNDATIEVCDAGTGEGTSHPVAPGKTTTVPVPVMPEGGLIFVKVGRGLRAHVLIIEVTRPR